jgi:hypothetical protein
MGSGAANTIVMLGVVYAALGLAFAIPFVLRGAARIDPDAEHGTWGFKLLILPGAAAFWPLLLVRWLRGAPPPAERSPHRDAAAREAS